MRSHRVYSDPFNDVDVDVIFSKGGRTWRVPTFWRGGQRWTVRFAPPEPGTYAYRLESTDHNNPDLNGHAGHVTVTSYRGANPLLRHGMFKLSADRRYFEQADGTPFPWLGDTWWTGLSDRLSWENFKTLTLDRKEKGFTVVQICAGLVPPEELAPSDPGFHNEGGFVWDSDFKQINPQYFDYADRRIQYLINAGIAPAIVGGWGPVLHQMGIAKMRKHWRYIIARYGAYPVFWIGGGEVYDPPETGHPTNGQKRWTDDAKTPGWSDVIRYIRAADPYHHPLTVHELVDVSLQDPLLTDFELIQAGHMGWAAIGYEIAELNMRYSRTMLTKPLVVGEIGYEMIGGTNLQDFQRAAFWLAMLNGAAGYTYGAAPTYEVNNPAMPLHRAAQYTFMTWKEGMSLPGSYQVGLGSALLRKYPWWRFVPHPEWIVPHGTTLLEPRNEPADFGLTQEGPAQFLTEDFLRSPELVFPGGEWRDKRGTFRHPYAAGVDDQVRIIYIPPTGLFSPPPPTFLNLDRGIRYHAYYWDPMLGIRFDLGTLKLPEPGPVLFQDSFKGVGQKWVDLGAPVERANGQLTASGDVLSVITAASSENAIVSVDARSEAQAGVVLRYQDAGDYVAGVYSAHDRSLYLVVRANGINEERLGLTIVGALGPKFRLKAEVRSAWAAAEISDGRNTYKTPIVDISTSSASGGSPEIKESAVGFGLFHEEDGHKQHFESFEVRRSPEIGDGGVRQRVLYDAAGTYRGKLAGPEWDSWGDRKAILLDSYRPANPPTAQDWVLILEKDNGSASAP